MRIVWSLLAASVLGGGAARADEGPYDATVITRAAPTLAGLCTGYLEEVAGRRQELEANAKAASIPVARAFCRRATTPLGVPFAASAMYKRAFFVELSDGLMTELRVVVEVPRGLVLTSIGWLTVDPFDPGCPGDPRPQGLAALRIENGFLVAVLKQDIVTFDEQGASHLKDILGATWCGEAQGALRCRAYLQQSGNWLGRFSITQAGDLVRED